MKNFKEIQTLLSLAEPDLVKALEKGNISAGIRVRKAMQQIRTLATQVRKDVADSRKD